MKERDVDITFQTLQEHSLRILNLKCSNPTDIQERLGIRVNSETK